MDAIQYFQRLHQHRMWVNAKLLAAVSELNDEQRHKLYAIGQGSLWKSLVHLYGAEYVWLQALLGIENAVLPGDLPTKLPGNQEGEGGIRSIEELKQNWTNLDKQWSDYLASLPAESLDQAVYRKRATGERFGSRRSDVLLHVCTHAHYTTAQVINMLRQSGVEKLPDIMMISLARQDFNDANP
jgi:uncharacterized damage-inducible protein DinB